MEFYPTHVISNVILDEERKRDGTHNCIIRQMLYIFKSIS